jgi:hypothetical protein
VYSQRWVKTTLKLNLKVKSQLLYHQGNYNEYQEYLYDCCVKLKKSGLGYRRISYKLNEMGLKSVLGCELKNNHIYSILKKGKIRKDRIKKLKSHNDYHKMIQNMKLEFREIDT